MQVNQSGVAGIKPAEMGSGNKAEQAQSTSGKAELAVEQDTATFSQAALDAAAAETQGNGSGTEPVFNTQGNGSGTEPPAAEVKSNGSGTEPKDK